MFEKGGGLFLILEKEFNELNRLLSKYYNTKEYQNEEDILQFMYDNCIFGIQF